MTREEIDQLIRRMKLALPDLGRSGGCCSNTKPNILPSWIDRQERLADALVEIYGTKRRWQDTRQYTHCLSPKWAMAIAEGRQTLPYDYQTDSAVARVLLDALVQAINNERD